MMKKTSVLSFVVLALLLPALLCGCVKNKRFDYSELNQRLRKTAPAFCFDETSLYYRDGAYFCFYSFTEEDDMLLALNEDENGKLKRITLTLRAGAGAAARETFCAFAAALSGIFIPEADTQRLQQETGLFDPARARQNTLLTFTQGFYSAALFSTAMGETFLLEYGARRG